ncbi:MAG: hypothetical protein WBA82_01140 [Castellaniella sp.]|jgi:hypothetical protein|uniref:hypothetical protein n=1 Tax=Castellaniella sp. TaxID=1955812 RepID=UPI003C784E78
MKPRTPHLYPSALLLTILLLYAGPSGAAPPVWDPARAAGLADWRWAAPQGFDLPGARLQMRRFRTPMAPADAARQLTRAGASRFDRLQFSGAVLSLSGIHGGLHWLAQLRPADDGGPGTIGLLSSLGPKDRREADFDPAELAPSGARPVLRASSRLAGGTGLMASYLCPGSYPHVAAAVRRALWDRRWRPVTILGDEVATAGTAKAQAAPVAGEWARPDGARLTVHLSPRTDAVTVTFWHRSKELS